MMTRIPWQVVVLCCLVVTPAGAADEYDFGSYLLDLGLSQLAQAQFQKGAKDTALSDLEQLWCRHGLGLVDKMEALQALAELEQNGGDAEAIKRADERFVKAAKALSGAADAYLERQNQRIAEGKPIEQLPPDERAQYEEFYHQSRLQLAEVYLFHAQVPGLDAKRRADLLRDSFEIFEVYAKAPKPLPRAVLGRGLVSFQMGNFQMALADFNEALAARAYSRPEEHRQILAYKFSTLIELKRFDVALREIEKHQRESGKRLADMELLRARALFGKGEKKEAYRIATAVARLKGPNASQATRLVKQWGTELGEGERAAGEVALADDKYDQGLFDEALTLYQKIAKQATQPELAAEASYKAGLCYLQKNQAAEAIQALAKVAVDYAKTPTGPEAAYRWVLATRHQYQDKRSAEARQALLDALDRVIQTYPKHEQLGQFRLFRGSALAEAGKLQEALAEFDQIPAASEGALEAMLARGETLASVFYALQRTAKPGSLEAKKAFGDAVAALTGAAAKFEAPDDPAESARRAPLLAKALTALARLYVQTGFEDHQKVTEILAKMPKGPAVDASVAQEAAALQITALVHLARFDELQRYVAELGNGRPARRTLDTALAALYNGLLAERDSKKPDAAQRTDKLSEALTQLLKTGDWSARQLYLAGGALGAVHQNDRAISVLDTLVKLYAGKPDAAEFVSRGRASRAECLRDAKRWREAFDDYSLLLKEKGNEESLLLNQGLASCLTELREFGKAIAQWRKVAGMLQPGTDEWFEARCHLADTLLRAGKKTEAADLISLTRDLHGDPPSDELKAEFAELERKCKEK